MIVKIRRHHISGSRAYEIYKRRIRDIQLITLTDTVCIVQSYI